MVFNINLFLQTQLYLSNADSTNFETINRI